LIIWKLSGRVGRNFPVDLLPLRVGEISRPPLNVFGRITVGRFSDEKFDIVPGAGKTRSLLFLPDRKSRDVMRDPVDSLKLREPPAYIIRPLPDCWVFSWGNVLLLLNCLRSRVGCRCCFELKHDIEEFELLRMGLFSCDVERLRLFELARKLRLRFEEDAACCEMAF